MIAIGLDIAPQAVATGRTRILQAAPALADHAYLVQADVTQLPFQHAGACYILDLGCSHGLPLDLRARYAAGIVANLQPGAIITSTASTMWRVLSVKRKIGTWAFSRERLSNDSARRWKLYRLYVPRLTPIHANGIYFVSLRTDL